MNPEAIVNWSSADSSALEKAQAAQKPMLIFFPGEDESFSAETYMADLEIAAMVDAEAIFVKVAYTSDREPSPDASDSPVPVCKLLSDNPTRDYEVRTYPTFVVADCYGNEFYRTTKQPKAKDLQGYFGKIEGKMEDSEKSLQKNLDKAKDYVAKEDQSKALKSILKNFKEELVGYEAQEETIRLYYEILDAGRTELAALVEDGTEDAAAKLKAMKSTFKDTELESEIDEALKGIN